MPSKQIKQYLEDHHVKYISIDHSPTYTAQEVAASAHISGKQVAKTVVVKIDGKFAMVVLPATGHVNFSELKEIATAKEVDLARESEFKSKFPECEVGAMPPFGNLYGMQVFVSSELIDKNEIAFNGGSHSELIKMSFEDFEKLVKPKVITMH